MKPYEGVNRSAALEDEVRGSCCGCCALGGQLAPSSLEPPSKWREVVAGALCSPPELGKLPRLAVIMRSSICEAREALGGLL